MNTTPYIAPKIEVVELDQSISLALESIPPYGPYETFNQSNNGSDFDLFQTKIT